ncbi:hypothetical protein [Mitsuaria sp. GD03876]|uniref:hypothetical protein n=1 Tax=Mitsuaria sp. GD03876 TaxID=2975399 RepID=UPI00244AB573|nr:hypothetical protein [Mitsuaria sp. GD03876]MDH0863261.1 hypothetical protein [Mitsuaria sp. GD03876]
MAAEPMFAWHRLTRRSAGPRPAGSRLAWRWLTVMIALQAPSWLWQMATGNLSFEERPLFNLDLVVAAIVACFSTWLGLAALGGAWIAEGLRAAAKNYHFMSVFDFVDAGRFASLLSLGQFVTVASVAAAAVLLLCAWTVLRQARGRPRLALALAAALLVLPLLDGVNGSLRVAGLGADQSLVPMNVAGSPAWNILNGLRAGLYSDAAPRPSEDPAAFHRMRDWHAAHPGRSVLLVLVESMGLPRSSSLAAWLAGRLDTPALRGRWRLSAGSEPFSGNTTSGELRVLCGLRGHYSRLTDALAAGCLPAQWRRDGMTAAALHGFHLRMFDRRDWWPRIGLEPWNGRVREGSVPEVGCNRAFPGLCDRPLLREAVAQAGEAPGRFIYALTLDTHLPVPTPAAPIDPVLATYCEDTRTPLTACEFVARVGGVLDTLAVELAASDATPLVVVVGDHSPPFAERANRDAFDPSRVPLFVLEPAP